ncbi:hypothetical protein [Halobacillus salinus]|uniref:hypothetical protein n=1 Tax=Halobacillus salinus TaxID=192814 RepID=UPI0013053E51|nr:hypothetical protein [Halobacillus salinus]
MARKGNIQPPSDFAKAFSQPMKYNQAFSRETEHEEDHSESDAMLHHYTDPEDK